MQFSSKVFLLLIILSVLVGYANPGALGMSIPVFPQEFSLNLNLFQVTADPNPTATPFQPIPPTEVFFPTNTPLPTLTPSSPTETPIAPSKTPTPIVSPTLLPTFTPSVTPSIEPSPDFDFDEFGEEIDQPEGQFNILLLGADKRPWQRKFRTDTIVLVTLNSKLGRINLTSFPRDLFVTIPGYGKGRINTAYTYGDFQLLKQTFNQNFGVKPEYYVLVNFKEFKTIIDSLGGLNVEVGHSVSDYRAGRYITIQKGEQHMDADTVLWYVRTRKTTNDIARNRRQQEVLMAIVRKLISLDGIKRAPEFYNLYKDHVETNIGLTKVISWIPLAFTIVNNQDINSYFITYKDVYDWITPQGAMVLIPKMESVMFKIRKSQNLH